MKKFNYIFLRLRLLIMFYIFPILLSLIILYMVCRSQTHFIVLCDDDGYTLYNLKVDLTLEAANYRKSLVDYELYTDLLNQLRGRSYLMGRDPAAEQNLLANANYALTKLNQSLDRVRDIEGNIRIISPGFRSPITQISFPRVGR